MRARWAGLGLLCAGLWACGEQATPGTDASTGGAPGSDGSLGSGGATPGGAGGGPGAGGATTGGATGAGGQPSSGGQTSPGGQPGGGGPGAGGTPGSSCDAALRTANRETVAAALDGLFVEHDTSVIDEYWADPYLNHNPAAQSGVAAFKGFFGNISPSFQYERLHTLADCELAVVHGEYGQTGIIFDMFRLDDGKLVEHWDSGSGRASPADGSIDVNPAADSAASEALVRAFWEEVLAGGDTTAAANYLGETLVDHRNTGTTGPDALLDQLDSRSVTYETLHYLIADGDFVFTLSEGELGGSAYGLYDLYRIAGGRIVEHWDSSLMVQAGASGLGIF